MRCARRAAKANPTVACTKSHPLILQLKFCRLFVTATRLIPLLSKISPLAVSPLSASKDQSSRVPLSCKRVTRRQHLAFKSTVSADQASKLLTSQPPKLWPANATWLSAAASSICLASQWAAMAAQWALTQQSQFQTTWFRKASQLI